MWWDTEPAADVLALETSTDEGATWEPLPFTAARKGDGDEEHPAGTATGWSGRAWHRLTAPLPAGPALRVRWRSTTDRLYVGRGAYVDGLRVERAHRVLFDESRPADAARLTATGWTASRD